jgi:hypothetical protein
LVGESKDLKNGAIQTVVNAKKQNNNTIKNVTPFPDQDLIRLDIAQVKYHSKVDLSNAYEQIPVVPEDVWKTVFAIVLGTFESLVMQQENCNTPATFQQLMNSIFYKYIGLFMHTYLDNIFMFSNMVKEHQKHLQLIFNKLQEHKLYLHANKGRLYAKKLECLSHMIDDQGLHADSDKIARICKWKALHNYHEVQQFLGLV